MSETIKQQKTEWDNIRCLVVDDDRFARTFIISALNHVGLVYIKEADSADRAMDVLQNNKIDIIFLDQQMPSKTGLDFIRDLRSSDNEELKKTPIIMVTIDAKEKTILDAKELGVDDYVIKPISPLVLRKRIRDALGFSQEG
ncbi:MAG: response regulator [Lactobacillaceae bacterium]|nr:response regulator [Lactobacillaceae bacterium]